LIQDPKEIKLYREGIELSDSTTLAESKAENGDTIAMAFALPGGTSLFPAPFCPSSAESRLLAQRILGQWERSIFTPAQDLIGLYGFCSSTEVESIWGFLYMILVKPNGAEIVYMVFAEPGKFEDVDITPHDAEISV
jgi:hypothetical protein